MKIVIYTTSPESARLLMEEIQKTSHLIVETVAEPDRLVSTILETTPHLLVAHATGGSGADRLVQEHIHTLFPELSFCWLSGDLSKTKTVWQPMLQNALAQPVKPPTPRPYAEIERYVYHAQALQQFWKGKLNRAERKEGWEKVCAFQEAKFVLQLQTGRKNHAAAKRYLECLLAHQSGLDQELAYRLAHGSYKALSWSRDLAAKWLALLAHYVPDVELEYLPIPGTSGPSIDYVHHTLPMEGVYAALAVLYFTVKPPLAETIYELVTIQFDGQDDPTLLALSIRFYGLAKFLEQVGRVQVELMDAWLDPTIVSRTGDPNIPRGEHRSAGIYRDFYDLTYIVLSPEPLAAILKGFHAGTTYVEGRRFLPTFAEFRKLWRETGTIFPSR